MAPVQNFQDQPVPVGATNLPADEISRQIKAAGASLGWSFADTGAGKMTGTQNVKGRAATVEVTYSQTSYSINLLSSTNLYQKGDEISAHYNVWARNLKAAIDRQLILAGTKS